MHVGPLGVTGLTVSRLGLGAGHLGGPELDERRAGSLLHARGCACRRISST
jgi:aryl-alcohol dehydrogenase-like predicted oxidoreductase